MSNNFIDSPKPSTRLLDIQEINNSISKNDVLNNDISQDVPLKRVTEEKQYQIDKMLTYLNQTNITRQIREGINNNSNAIQVIGILTFLSILALLITLCFTLNLKRKNRIPTSESLSENKINNEISSFSQKNEVV